MQDGPVDACGVHIAKRFLDQIGRGAVERGWRALAPKVNLRVDDRHSCPPLTASKHRWGRVTGKEHPLGLAVTLATLPVALSSLLVTIDVWKRSGEGMN